jgi:hypothetical protein
MLILVSEGPGCGVFYFVSLVPNECNEIPSFSPELQFVVDFLASKE